MRKLIIATLMAIPALSMAHEHGAHVHGTADIDIAIDGNKVQITLDSPADNIVGFEHAPKTEAEKAALKKTAELLNQPDKLFKLNGQCQAEPAQVTLPVFGKSAHADIEATYTFTCKAAPTKIDLPFWQAFPRTHKITADIATASGQQQQSLQSGQSVVLK